MVACLVRYASTLTDRICNNSSAQWILATAIDSFAMQEKSVS